MQTVSGGGGATAVMGAPKTELALFPFSNNDSGDEFSHARWVVFTVPTQKRSLALQSDGTSNMMMLSAVGASASATE